MEGKENVKIKNIVWFDVETTGLDMLNDRIIQIYLCKTDFEGNVIAEFQTYVNPDGVKSHPNAIEKHGITDEFLLDYDKFSYIAPEINEFIGDCDLGGYNIVNFDIPFLMEELMRAGIVFNYRGRNILDPLTIYRKSEPRDLGSAYKKFTGKTLEGAHDAANDVLATIEIFNAQKSVYDLPSSATEIDKIFNEGKDDYLDLGRKFKLVVSEEGVKQVYMTFGKYKDRLVSDVVSMDPNYIDWIINKGQFSSETKIICKKLFNHYSK